MRRLQRQEVRRLRSALPLEVRRRRDLDEVEVINEAARYIDQLHAAIVARVKAGLMPPEILRSLRHIPACDIIGSESRCCSSDRTRSQR
uniref:BHLH domain-containing protein n=1 Tax=Trichuris muris TaxID=70415 RepID=A0A5S6Q515_TRIMR